MPGNDKLKVLYETVSKEYDLGTYDQFQQKISDPAKRKAFYDSVGQEYDLGDYSFFEQKLGFGGKPLSPQASATMSEMRSFNKSLTSKPGDMASLPSVKNPVQDVAATKEIDQKSEALATKYATAEKNTVKKRYEKQGIKVDENSPQFKKDLSEVRGARLRGELVTTSTKSGEPVLSREQNLAEGVWNSLVQSFKDPIEGFKVNSISDPKELADYFDKKQKEKPEYEESVPGFWGAAIGNLPKPLLLMGGGSAALTPVGGLGLMGGEAQHTGMAMERENLYFKRLNQLVSEGVPIEKARISAAQDAIDNSWENALPNAVAQMTIGTNLIKVPVAAQKNLVDALAATTKSVVKNTGGGMTAEALKVAMEKVEGYEVSDAEINERLKEAAVNYGLLDVAFKVMSGAMNAPKYLKSAAKEYLINVPEEALDGTLNQMGETGVKIAEELGKYREAREKVQDFVPEESISSFAGLVEKKTNLQQKMEADLSKADTSLHPDIKAEYEGQIKAIDKQIAEMRKTEQPINLEMDELTGERVSPVTVEEQRIIEETDNAVGKLIDEKSVELFDTKKPGLIGRLLGKEDKSETLKADITRLKEKPETYFDDLAKQDPSKAGEYREQKDRYLEAKAKITERGLSTNNQIERLPPPDLELDPKLTEEKMRPITDKMAEVEMAFENNKLDISPDYDNEIIIRDRNGSLLSFEDLTPELQKMAADYETATRGLGEFDETVFQSTLAESRKRIRGEETQFEEVRSALPESQAPKPEINPVFEANNKVAQELGFDNAPHAIASVKKRLGKEYKTFEEIPQSELQKVARSRNIEAIIPLDKFKEDMITYVETVKSSSFDFRLDIPGMDQKTREGAIKDIRAGKTTKRAQQLISAIEKMYEDGIVSINRGRGNHTEAYDIPLEDWFSSTPESRKLADNIDESTVRIIAEEGLTLDNIDKFEHLFNDQNFPYGKEEFQSVKDHLRRQAESGEQNRQVGERGKTGEEGRLAEEARPEQELKSSEIENIATFLEGLADKIEGDKSTLNTDITAIPRAALATALRVTAKALRAGQKLSEALAAGFEKLKEQYKGKDFNEAELRDEFIDLAVQDKSLAKRLKKDGLLPSGKTPSAKALISESTDSKIKGKVNMTLKAALKKQILDVARGWKQGTKEQADLQKQFTDVVTNYVKEAELNGSLEPKQAKALLTRAAKVGTNPKRLQDFIKFADKVIDDANYAGRLSEAKSLQKKVTSDKSAFANNLDVLRSLKRIPVENLSPEGLERFIEIAENYRKSKLPVGNKEYTPFKTDEAIRQLESIQKELDDQVIKDAEELSGVTGLSKEEADLMREAFEAGNFDAFESNLEEAKAKTLRDGLIKQAEYSQYTAEDISAYDFHSAARRWLKQIASADLSKLANKDLVSLIKTIDNAAVNGSVANLGLVYSSVLAAKNAPELVKAGRGLKLFNLNKIQEAAESIPVMLKAVFGQSKAVAEWRNISGFDKVFNGGAAAHRLVNNKWKEFEKFRKSIGAKNDAVSRYRRGIYADVIQHNGGTPAEIQAQFLENKNKIEQSIEVYSRTKSTERMAEVLREIYTTELEPFNTLDEFAASFKQKYSTDVKAVEFWNSTFDAMKDDVKFITEAYENLSFEDVHNYTPRSYQFVDSEAQIGDTNTSMRSISRYPGKPEQTPTSISRVKMKNIPRGMALSFDFDGNMVDKYQRTVYDIKTIEGRHLFNAMSKQDGFAESVGGVDNKKRIIRQYNLAEQVQSGAARENDIAGEIIKQSTNIFRDLGTVYALGGFTQAIKQWAPVGLKTAMMLGKDMGLLLDAHSVKIKDIPLLELASIADRGSRKGGTDRGASVDEVNRAKLRTGASKVIGGINALTQKGREISMLALTATDASIAKRSWLAYYMKFLKEKGVEISKKDLPTEHERIDDLRESAMSYATQMVEETQTVNNAALLSNIQRNDKNAFKELFKNVLIPFNTFSSNVRARMIEDVKFLTYGNDVQRAEAARDLGSNIAEIATFQAINTYILYTIVKYPGSQLLGYLFDLDDEDKKYKDGLGFETKKFYSNFARDVVAGGMGGSIESTFIEGLNQAAWFLHKSANPDDEATKSEWMKKAPFYSYSGDGWQKYAGQYGIYFKETKDIFRDLEGAMTSHYDLTSEFTLRNETETGMQTLKVKNEEEVELSPEDQRYLRFVTLMNIMAFAGVRDADIARMVEAKKRETLRKYK